MTNGAITGWDIGGAHLKMAVINPAGHVVSVKQYPTPLWQGLDTLHTSLRQALNTSPRETQRHAVTTTAELADIFQDRKQGMQALTDCLLRVLDKDRIHFYSGGADWIQPEHAASHYQRIASANWHATASYAASIIHDGILLDIGSTTTDITGFRDGHVCSRGYTDYERLASSELVYSGIVRTPVIAVTHAVKLADHMHSLVAEVFATMADVYRLLGQLDEEDDMLPTPDGAGKGMLDSARRLARMTGRDITGEESITEWQSVAEYIADQQKDRISQALEKAFTRMNSSGSLTIVGAGAGAFLAESVASIHGLSYVNFADLLDTTTAVRKVATRSAPAVAVALLARQMA